MSESPTTRPTGAYSLRRAGEPQARQAHSSAASGSTLITTSGRLTTSSRDAWYAVLTRGRDTAHLRRLREAGERAGLRLEPWAPADWLARLPRGFGERGAPRAVLLRLASGAPSDQLAALAAHEHQPALTYVDPPSVVAAAHDKGAALARLDAAGLPVPATVCVRRDALPDPGELPAGPLVLKPARGAGGRGVTLGLDRAAALAHAAAFAELTGAALLQAFHGDGRDRRAVVIGDRVVAGMQRTAREDDGRANVARGASARSVALDDDECSLARDAARVLGLSVAGVDLIAGPDGPLVLEVNTCPGLEALVAACGPAPADALVAHLAAR